MDSVTNVREKEPLHIFFSQMLKKHNYCRYTKKNTIYLGHTQKIQKMNETVTDLEYATETEPNDANKLNRLDIKTTHELKNNTSTEDDQSSKHNCVVSEDKNETANRFLKELYDKKLDLNNKFSDQEIKDIHQAVQEIVTLLAKTIGKIDPRLKIQEVIPVSSAKEDTQTIRPCEFDYILLLEAFSKPGIVSLESLDSRHSNDSFVYVKLEDDDVRLVFLECCENNYLRGSYCLPCFRH